MSARFGIIDLFAGPGGLGEGFSRAGAQDGGNGGPSMDIRLSVEMDPYAVQTLRLRAFLRQFNRPPSAYYDALNAGGALPDWAALHPVQWARANAEVRQRVLGGEGVFEELAADLDRAREELHGNTILIGGPPCQAYSLVGRARNKGKAGYVPEDDGRHYLYREYVRILNRLRPAVFVMENVKGMLSSKVDGGGIFNRVLEDLERAGDGYRLLPLAVAPKADGSRAGGRDFLIHAEKHGVPQARHRVIVLGVRGDLAAGLQVSGPLLGAPQDPVSVAEAIGGLPALRSGLSKGDGPDLWLQAVRAEATALAETCDLDPKVRAIARKVARANDLPCARVSRALGSAAQMPKHLADWLLDRRLLVTLHHETRGHIARDLGRYLFSAASTQVNGQSPKLAEFPEALQPAHRNRASGHFADRFRTQAADRPATTVTSHISKDGHYFIHPDPMQCRALTVREAARLQTFPDNYLFMGGRTQQYHQVGNAVPPYLAFQIARAVQGLLG